MEGKFKIEGNTVNLYLEGSVKQIEVKGCLSYPHTDEGRTTIYLTEYQKFLAEYDFPKDKDTFICVGMGMGTTYALKLNRSLKDKTKFYYQCTRWGYNQQPLLGGPYDYLLFDGGMTIPNYQEAKNNGDTVVSVLTPASFKEIAGDLKGDYNLITWKHEFNPHTESDYIGVIESLPDSTDKRLKGSWRE